MMGVLQKLFEYLYYSTISFYVACIQFQTIKEEKEKHQHDILEYTRSPSAARSAYLLNRFEQLFPEVLSLCLSELEI